MKNKTQKCTSRYLLIHIARQKRDKLSHPSNYCFHVLFCRFTAHALKRIARTHSRLDARVCHYTHSSVWIMRDGRLIIILIVTYNIRCIGAISFTCVHDTRRYIFLDQLFSRATMRDHSGRQCLAFSCIFIFPQGKSNTSFMSLEISAWWSFTAKNFVSSLTYLNLLDWNMDLLSFARQQRRSIIHQWTMFGTDCSGPQLAASVSLFIQFSLVLHLFLFFPSSSECMYTFSCQTYFLRYYPVIYSTHIPKFEKIN